jgi:hypothetical protein
VQHGDRNIELVLSWRTARYREMNVAVLSLVSRGWPGVLVLSLGGFLSKAGRGKKYGGEHQRPTIHCAPFMVKRLGVKWEM